MRWTHEQFIVTNGTPHLDIYAIPILNEVIIFMLKNVV